MSDMLDILKAVRYELDQVRIGMATLTAIKADAERYQLRLETIRALYPDAPTDAELDIAIDAALQGEQS